MYGFKIFIFLWVLVGAIFCLYALSTDKIKVREIPDPWEVHGTAEYAKMCPDQLITIAEMEADARRAIPADKIKTGSKED